MLLTAAAVVAVDHAVRATYLPLAVFGVPTPGPFRWLEHTAWVLLEVIGLAWCCRRGLLETDGLARRQAELEQAHASVEARVAERTVALERAVAAVEAERVANAALARELEAVSDSMVDGVLLVGCDGRTAHVNLAAGRLVGLYDGDRPASAAELGLRRADGEPVEPERDPFRAAREGTVLDEVYLLPGRDGRPASWVSVSVRPLRGHCHGGIVMLRDITEQRRLEALKDDFVCTVSHELRTPLTSISGSLELMLGGVVGPLPPAATSLLEIATRNSERLVRLINDLLDVEKIASGRIEITLGDLDLRAALERTLAANQGFALTHEVALRLEAPEGPEPLLVQANADRVEQVLTNLLSNACKFSPAGAEVTVSVALDPASGVARVAVRDHGPGIPVEFHGRVFERFAQADRAATRKQGGTGLGLSICKALVERMGGEIGFETAQGEGTTFTFTLPLARTAPSAAPCAAACVPALDAAPPACAGWCPARVLICESDPRVSGPLQETLQAAGFRCDVAQDVERCRDLLADGGYQVVLLEPDHPGLELLHDEMSRRAEPVPVPFLSAAAADLEAAEPWRGLLAAVGRLSGQPAAPRVLYLEDDPDLVRVVGATLAGAATVIPAPTLADARALLAREPFDVALVDLGLPDGSGLDLLPALREREVPAIVFSALEVNLDVRRRVRAALVKSCTTRRKLLEAVRSALDTTRPAPPPALIGSAS